MLPVLGGKVVERQQHVLVLDQFGVHLVVFHAVGFDEEVEGGFRVGSGFGLSDVVQLTRGLRLD